MQPTFCFPDTTRLRNGTEEMGFVHPLLEVLVERSVGRIVIARSWLNAMLHHVRELGVRRQRTINNSHGELAKFWRLAVELNFAFKTLGTISQPGHRA